MWNVTASISGPKSVVTRVSSLSFKTVLLYDKIVVRGIVKMPVSWRWTPLLLFKTVNVTYFLGIFFKFFFRNLRGISCFN